MIILNIYVATILFALIAHFLLQCEVKIYCKEHDIHNARKMIFARRVMNDIKILLMCIIPLYNVFSGFCALYAVLSTPTLEKAVQINIDNGTFKRGK
jgi:hypothetical protein